MHTASGRIPSPSPVRRPFAIAGGEHDLQLIDLIPLRIGALSFRDGEQRLQASAG